MKTKLVIVSSLFLISFFSFSQYQGDGGKPKGVKNISQSQIHSVKFQEPNIAELRAEDEENDILKTGPWRFGYNNETELSMENSGSWFNIPNGGKVWLLKLKSTNALTINLSLKDVVIPEGNELYVYNEDKSFILGKFTSNHLYEGQLGTELVPGDVAIVEYYVAPANREKTASLTVERVTHGYRTANEFQAKAFGSSGSCNMNVNCPDGDEWGDQKRGVVMLVSGSNGFCTGSMINNTANDGTPYVLTANHCYSNPATWIFRFNWESSTCANPGSSPTFQSLSGAVLRSRRTPTDFCLVEITGGLESGTVPASYNTFFSGWDNTGAIPTSTVGIHHPSGDIKKIAFDDNASSAVQEMGSAEINSSWRVVWDRNTTTEGGSSGSPLFDQNHRIIGQLWGGSASCSNLTGPDFYGRLTQSWEPAGSNSTNQLKYWLDPSGTGTTVVDGYDPNAVSVDNDGGIQSIISPTGTYCDLEINPVVRLKNYGTNNLTSITITYSSTGVAPSVYNWTGDLASGDSEDIALPTMTPVSGNSVFNAATSLPNGVADNNDLNDSKVMNFSAIANGINVDVTIRTDCYGDESTWEIINSSDEVVLSGGPYGDAMEINVSTCLSEGCYIFKMMDEYGDGMTYTSTWGCSASNVGYWVREGGTDLVTMTNADFGDEVTHDFCLGSANPCDGAAPLSVSATGGVSSGSNGTTTSTTSGGVGPYEYQWSGPGGYTSTSQNLIGLVPGNYTVTVTDDCGTEATQSVVVQSSVSIHGANNGQFAVYPNPNSGSFSIEFLQFAGENYTISLMDLTGRVIYSTKGSEIKKTIHVGEVATGKYILNVKTPTSSSNQSLMIKN